MDLEVAPSQLSGAIRVPPSKSQTLRAILFASLASGVSRLDNLLESPDQQAMQTACASLGARITPTTTGIEIEGTGGRVFAPDDVIDAGNSGIVLRFISALSALSSLPVVVTGDASIRHQRSMQTLLDALIRLDVSARSTRNNGFAPLIIQGPVTRNVTTVNGKDSQPVSALLILGAFLNQPLEITVENPGETPWVSLTLDWMDFLGVPYQRDGFTYFRIGGGPAITGFHYIVPGDMSSAAFPVTAAVITNTPLTVSRVDFNDKQGDKKYFHVLQQMGANLTISQENRSITIHPGPRLKGITVDINDFIDAVCILAVAACYAVGETRLTNASVARGKECNRLQALVLELTKMGAKIRETEDGLVIQGSPLHHARVSSHGDHRMAMALAVAAMGAEGSTLIEGVDCVAKTYATFVEDFTREGADFHVHCS